MYASSALQRRVYIRQNGPGLFVLHILPTAFFVFESVLELLAVGHGDT